MNDLQKYELENLDELDDKENSFVVCDLNSANWVFKKLAAIQAKENEVIELANTEKEKIEQWKEKELEKYSNSKGYLEHLITNYYKEQKLKDKKFTLKTPYGRISQRKGSKVLQVSNENNVIEELEKRGFKKYIKVTKKLNQADIKKEFNSTDNGTLIDTNGEILEGIYLVQKPTTYSVKVGE
ncbi:host-nuclease inhibitor Gam family protein [Staphylococcus haemolyticus]|uniref:host-nuclease inhibitor Gam family protein n=1 Tax=Staphylococcus haemolyticus TaxID=1283 RepID=UPI00051CCA71|nr:host-nuclease inhibitor Gam family protein [Staphylococcus haemolyticus]KGJ25355.1 hypothetical protein ES24_09725 [Staphylococcus haemolyticus]KGJ29259.1 hypothetical protein ES23_05780 [Staphylococcus haemolyticus]MCH4326193.1 host-nuclease inhibitor Gam family protein [Staphylococcus haemolyticus]MCH4414282.1 host-nuclease inhibitor Gam family protein [Staphylococcus haemolyticus]MCH4419092.1 host-nuclease inhibitor Gam family protein [Staphylococcus haemolyticus]